MIEFLSSSAYFGLMLSIVAFMLGEKIKSKIKTDFINPFLISVVIVIIVLTIFEIDYDVYNVGASHLAYFLTPATICLAIPLYEQIDKLKNNFKAILIAVASGAFSSMLCIYILSLMFKLNYEQYLTFLPKSITTAIALGVNEEYGGNVAIMIVCIIITGVLGNSLAVYICKTANIKHPISKGLAIGTASHAIGTARAIEMGEVEGAMSGLAVVVAGISTVVFMSFFTMIY